MRLEVPWRAIAIALAIHSLWGGNPIALKFALPVFPPMWSAFLRFVLGSLCVLAWARWARIPVWPTREEWPALVWIAALFTVQIGTMNIGIDLSTGAMGAVVMATNPIFAALFAHFLVRGDRLTPLRFAGLVVAFAGTALVVARGVDPATLDYGALGSYILLFSTGLLGFRLAFSARALKKMNEVRVALWQMVLSMPFFALGGWWFETIEWAAFDWRAGAGLAYQGLIVAGLGFLVSMNLMRRFRPSIMMSFNFVSPLVGVAAAALLLGEAIGPELLAGMALVAAGMVLVTMRGAADQ